MSQEQKTINILFVCLGNICRSPMGEGLFRHHVEMAKEESQFYIDSAGVGAWHIGNPPDSRMITTAAGHDVDISKQKARQFRSEDLEAYDLILCMDRENQHDVLYLDSHDEYGHKVKLLREFDSHPEDYQVPDPYYGGDQGFENVFQMLDRSTKRLLESLLAHEANNPMPSSNQNES